MNILSLRVSTMRGNENLKKNSEVRMEKLQVLDDLIAEFDGTGESDEFVLFFALSTK